MTYLSSNEVRKASPVVGRLLRVTQSRPSLQKCLAFRLYSLEFVVQTSPQTEPTEFRRETWELKNRGRQTVYSQTE